MMTVQIYYDSSINYYVTTIALYTRALCCSTNTHTLSHVLVHMKEHVYEKERERERE